MLLKIKISKYFEIQFRKITQTPNKVIELTFSFEN